MINSKTNSSKAALPKPSRKKGTDVEECKEEEASLGGTVPGDPATSNIKSGNKTTSKSYKNGDKNTNEIGLKKNEAAGGKKSKKERPVEKNADFDDFEKTGRWGTVSKTEVIIVSIVMVLIIVAVTVAVVVFVGDNGNENNDGSSGTTAVGLDSPILTPPEQMELIRSALEESPLTISVWDDLGETEIENPYRMAAAWIVEKDTRDREADILPRFALAAFYYMTGGNQWLNSEGWLTNKSVCDGWFGITCDIRGNVLEVELPKNNLKGPFPVPLILLKSLNSLWLENNSLEGYLPESAFPEMPNLQFLYLQHNKFTGTIPTTFLDNGDKLRKYFISDNDNGNVRINALFCNDILLSTTVALLQAHSFFREMTFLETFRLSTVPRAKIVIILSCRLALIVPSTRALASTVAVICSTALVRQLSRESFQQTLVSK